MIQVLFEQQCLRIVYQWLHVCERHILQYVLHIFSLWWSGDLVVLQVCWLASPLCDSFPLDPTLTWTLPVNCTSRGLMLLGVGAMCLPLFKGRANMIPAFRSHNWDGPHLLAQRRSVGCGGIAVEKVGNGKGWGRVFLVVLILSWNVPVRHQPWRSSSQSLFSSAWAFASCRFSWARAPRCWLRSQEGEWLCSPFQGRAWPEVFSVHCH